MQWYFANNQQKQGPVSEADFNRLVSENVIQAQTLVWRQGMANWQRYAEIAPTFVPPLPPLVEGAPVASSSGSSEEMATCLISGKQFPKREMTEFQGRWVSAEHREQFFKHLRDGVPVAGHFNFGGFWIRVVAVIIDWVILYLVNAVADNLYSRGRVQSGINFNNPFDPDLIMAQFHQMLPLMVLNFALLLAYECFFIGRFSATPGKLACGLKIVRPDGGRLGIGRIIARRFAKWVDMMTFCIGYLVAAFDEEKRALHDYICDTRVIKSR